SHTAASLPLSERFSRYSLHYICMNITCTQIEFLNTSHASSLLRARARCFGLSVHWRPTLRACEHARLPALTARAHASKHQARRRNDAVKDWRRGQFSTPIAASEQSPANTAVGRHTLEAVT